jgi:hypothetical protein
MWIDNIKMDILEIGVSVVDWIGLAQDRYRCKLSYEPSGSMKCWKLPSSCTSCGLLSGTQLHRVSLVMKNGVFWVVTPCGSCENRRFGGIWRTSVASCSLCFS